jgi:hypothetical protein
LQRSGCRGSQQLPVLISARDAGELVCGALCGCPIFNNLPETPEVVAFAIEGCRIATDLAILRDPLPLLRSSSANGVAAQYSISRGASPLVIVLQLFCQPSFIYPTRLTVRRVSRQRKSAVHQRLSGIRVNVLDVGIHFTGSNSASAQRFNDVNI